jgi:predicted house-cleaning noncanonical NTP pyrophosphatase (MazG superfamily)
VEIRGGVHVKHGKLVRDRIPEIIRQNGDVPVTHTASDDEYWQKLKEKLREEVEEFIEDEKEEELADILEIIDSICGFKKFDKSELETLRKKKAEERGSFRKKIILDETRN